MNAERSSSTNQGLILVITTEVPEAYTMIWTVHAWPLRGVPKIGIVNRWSEYFAVGSSVLPVGFPKREMSIFAFAPSAVYRGLPWDICPTIIYHTKITLFATWVEWSFVIPFNSITRVYAGELAPWLIIVVSMLWSNIVSTDFFALCRVIIHDSLYGYRCPPGESSTVHLIIRV